MIRWPVNTHKEMFVLNLGVKRGVEGSLQMSNMIQIDLFIRLPVEPNYSHLRLLTTDCIVSGIYQ